MKQETAAIVSKRSVLHELLWISLAGVLVIASYIWSANAASPKWTSPGPPGYYGLLTDALLARQLYLKIEPDPRLAALANPYAGAQGVPRIHDATYFNGHYYLYFGVTPVIILFAPWRLATGTFLTEGAATTIFASLGFLLCVRLWLRAKKELFPSLGSVWMAFGVLVLGWGTYAFFLLQNSVVYNVPILAAFACLMVAFNAIELAFTVSTSQKKALYFGIASLAWGLAVGARPNYALSLPVLGVLAMYLWQRSGREQSFRAWATWRILFWAVVPAAVVGVGLAWYNYMRFGNILEFGVKYQFAASDQRFLNLTNPANIPETLRSYLFAGAYYSPYYPFISPRADVLGILVWAPFAVISLLFPFSFLLRRDRSTSAWLILGNAFLVTVLLHLLSLCMLPFANDRYNIDFLPTATLLSLAVVGLAILKARTWPKAISYLVCLCAVVFAVVTLSQSLLLGFQRHTGKSAQHFLASVADYPARWWEHWAGVQHGAVDLQIVFPELEPGQHEPLVVSGFGRDIIFVESLDKRHARFGFFHQGTGGPVSEVVEIDPGRTYRLKVDMGGLYPPPEHSVFRNWDASLVEALRRRLDVWFEGKLVLHWSSSFYPSHPFEITIGKNMENDVTTPVLRASIVSISREGVPSPDKVPSFPGDGPLRLTVKFPAFANFATEPLVSTGRPGEGDLVYVTYLSRGRLRFGHDSWGGGNVETMDVDYDPDQEHSVDVDMGSVHRAATGLAESITRFQLCLDNKPLISTFRPFHPSSPLDLSIGFNTTGSTASSGIFTGPLLKAERLSSFSQAPVVYSGFGSFLIRAKLPPSQKGSREPLVVTCSKGLGDFIYLIYEDEQHLRVALDHGGVSSGMSDLIEITNREILSLVVKMGSFFPRENANEWGSLSVASQKQLRSTVSVEINGRLVLDLPITASETPPDEIYVGQNPIGGSACSSVFTGTLISVSREATPR